jgi:hypothetical protein
MSAVVTPRRTRRGRERDRDSGRTGARQESLFGAYAAPGTPAAPAVPAVPAAPEDPAVPAVSRDREPAPDSEHGGTAVVTQAPAAITGPTLDEAISGLWGELLGGDTATCPACGAPAMQPRHSAGAGVVGGRCGACDATLA